jgi:hypothetical protein
VPRPTFEPNDDQDALLRAIEHLAEQRRLLSDQLGEVDRQTDQLIAKADEAKIPIERIAKAAGRTRKTVYRHLGKPMK